MQIRSAGPRTHSVEQVPRPRETTVRSIVVSDRIFFLPRRAVSRRALLHGAMGGTLALVPLGQALAGLAPRRSLRFAHTHTGETLAVEYFGAGGYQPRALARINHLLRDFRTGQEHLIDPRVLDILFDLQALTDREATFEIISGYRSPQTNAVLHARSHQVAEHSLHMEGEALDIRVTGFSTAKLHQYALNMERGGVGYYPASDFVHVDCGRVRRWMGS